MTDNELSAQTPTRFLVEHLLASNWCDNESRCWRDRLQNTRQQHLAKATRRMVAGAPFLDERANLCRVEQVIMSIVSPSSDVLIFRTEGPRHQGRHTFARRVVRIVDLDRLYCVGRVVPVPPDAATPPPFALPGRRQEHTGLSCGATARTVQ